MDGNIIQTLAQSDNPLIAVLAFMNMALAGVVVAQWRYTINKTVPYKIWLELKEQFALMLQTQKDEFTGQKEANDKLRDIVRENIKECRTTNTLIQNRRK